MLFNLFSFKTNLDAKLRETIEEKEVTITDKYTVRTGDSSDSSYMTGTDGEQNYKIVGDGYEIGDVVKIYRNSNSVNAQAGNTTIANIAVTVGYLGKMVIHGKKQLFRTGNTTDIHNRTVSSDG